MRHFLGLDLHNVVTFKKVSVDFNKPLTYIRGLNLDSDPASPTGNGAGKTLLFSTLANVWYQSTPLALKKRAKKDILRQKGSSVGVIYKPSDDGPEYEIIQTSKGYKVFENGKDMELRTVPIAEEFLRKIFPMSELKFYSTAYLSTQRPYLIQRDTDSNRLHHFTDIFNLDQYSSIRDVLAVRARAIKDNELKVSVLEQQAVGLRRKLKELTKPASKEEYEAAKKEYDQIGKEISRLQERRFALTTRQRDLDNLLSIEKTLDELRAKYQFKKKPTDMIKLLKEQRKISTQWERWRERNADAKKMLDKIDRKLAELEKPSTSGSKIKKRIAKARDRLRELDDQIDQLARAKRKHAEAVAEVERLQTELEELGIEGKIPEGDFESEAAVLRSTIKLERVLEHVHEDDASCPTCMSPLNVKKIKTAVAKAKERLEEIAKYEEASRIRAELKAAKKAVPDFNADDLPVLREEKKALEADLEKLESEYSSVHAYESLVEQRAEIELPEKPEGDEPEHSLAEIDEYLELCSSIVDALSQKDLLLSNHEELRDLRSEAEVAKALKRTIRDGEDLDRDLGDMRSKQGKAAGIVSAFEQYRNTGRVYRTELDEVQAKIDKLTPNLEDKKILDILLKAYGPKGLRAAAAKSVCQLFQTNLNHYRDLIFAEPFTFEVKASETGISILVDRNNGKPDSVSDVRNLSGAESNAFQLLSMLSLLPLIPDSDRLNIAVLDEPTSHMDSVTRAIFNERFLPVLREVVPNIYVISPHADDSSPNSAEWVVKKHKGVSTLIAS